MNINLLSSIKLRLQVVILMIFITSGLSFSDLFSQNVLTKPSRQSSIEAFSNGKYDLAYDQFSELLLLYPKDPLYKYYSGVCLVKLNREPDKASTLLQQALQGAAVLKTLPSEAVFYLGRALQMSGKFSEAIDSYKKFEEQSGKKQARELGVPDYLQQCMDKKGQLVQNEADTKKIVEQEKPIPAVKNDQPVVDFKQQPVEKEKITKPALPSGFEGLLQEALDLQVKADSLRGVAASQKQLLVSVPDNKKEAAKKRISEIELLAASYQKKADEKFNEAEGMKPGNKVTYKAPAPETKEIKEVVKVPDNNIGVKDKPEPEVVVKAPDNNIRVKDKPEPEVPVFSVFKAIANPVFTVKDNITIDPEVPEGLVYRIQVSVFRNPVTPSYFKGITPVYGFRNTGKNLTTYYAGMFRKSSDAAKALITVKSKGFKDAFIVAFSGTKPVSAERAVALEKEWGKRSLMKELKSAPETRKDTLAPTLVFRIEVARSVKPLKVEVTEELKKIAGVRGLEIITADDGKFVYLIGKFITFESAADYNDLLIRNGYREAKVVAWLGRNQIPLETARQLFEKVE